MSMALISLISVCQGTAAKNRLKDLCWQFMKFLIQHATHFPAFHCKKRAKDFSWRGFEGKFCNFFSFNLSLSSQQQNRHPLSLQKILRMYKNAEHPKDSQTKWDRKKKSIWKQFLPRFAQIFFLWIVNFYLPLIHLFMCWELSMKSPWEELKLNYRANLFADMKMCICEVLNHVVVVGRFSWKI